jgi:hypothetical protein
VDLSLSYNISPRLHVKSGIYFKNKGEDPDTVSYGGNILNLMMSVPEFRPSCRQGALADIFAWNTSINFEITDAYLQTWILWRKKKSPLPQRAQETQSFQFAIRYNFVRREEIF